MIIKGPALLTSAFIIVILIEVSIQAQSKVTITSSMTIPCNDSYYQNNDIIIRGSNVVVTLGVQTTLQYTHQFNSLSLESGAKLTHEKDKSQGMRVLIIDFLTVNAGCSIDVTGCGHGEASGRGKGNSYSSKVGSGGGYGGVGGGSRTEDYEGGDTYGSVFHPVDLGSGGGRSGQETAGAGGGAVWLEVGDVVTVDGGIYANGEPPAGQYSGCGSGGSIYIQAKKFSGKGVISAN